MAKITFKVYNDDSYIFLRKRCTVFYPKVITISDFLSLNHPYQSFSDYYNEVEFYYNMIRLIYNPFGLDIDYLPCSINYKKKRKKKLLLVTKLDYQEITTYNSCFCSNSVAIFFFFFLYFIERGN